MSTQSYFEGRVQRRVCGMFVRHRAALVLVAAAIAALPRNASPSGTCVRDSIGAATITRLATLRGCGVQAHPERMHDLEQGGEVGAPFTGQSLVQAFAGQASVSGDTGHAACAGHISKRFGDDACVFACLFKSRLDVEQHFFFGAQVFRDIVGSGGEGHVSILQFLNHLTGASNIAALRALVAAAQKQDKDAFALRVINPIAGTDINAQFRYAAANGLRITRIPINQALYSDLDSRPPAQITKAVNPLSEFCGFAQCEHGRSVAYWIRLVNLAAPRSHCAENGFRLTSVNPSSHTVLVAETTAAGFDSLSRHGRIAAAVRLFYVRMPSRTFYGWALVGRASALPVSYVAGLSTLSCARPPHLTVGSGLFADIGGRIMRQSPHAHTGQPFPLDNARNAHASAAQSRFSIGDTVRTVSVGRTGTVTRVYVDGSASVRWHDKPSISLNLGHERISGSSLVFVEANSIEAICINALRDAVTAPTVFDALDITGVALKAIAAISRGEVRHG